MARIQEVQMKKVLFVCYGNICRSAMAEALCNFYGRGEIVAESAGTFILLPHFPMDKKTIKVMREIGLDVSGHRPRHIKTVDIPLFDILVNMSAAPDAILLRDHPSFTGQIIRWDVANPYSKTIGVYRKVRDEIQEKTLDFIQQSAS